MMAAKENMIAFSFANTPPLVAPFGEPDPLFGNESDFNRDSGWKIS